MAISLKQIKEYIELEINSEEMTTVKAIMNSIDNYLKVQFFKNSCCVNFDIFYNYLKQISPNRKLKILKYVAEEYCKVGWKVKIDSNYFSFYE